MVSDIYGVRLASECESNDQLWSFRFWFFGTQEEGGEKVDQGVPESDGALFTLLQ